MPSCNIRNSPSTDTYKWKQSHMIQVSDNLCYFCKLQYEHSFIQGLRLIQWVHLDVQLFREEISIPELNTNIPQSEGVEPGKPPSFLHVFSRTKSAWSRFEQRRLARRAEYMDVFCNPAAWCQKTLDTCLRRYDAQRGVCRFYENIHPLDLGKSLHL